MESKKKAKKKIYKIPLVVLITILVLLGIGIISGILCQGTGSTTVIGPGQKNQASSPKIPDITMNLKISSASQVISPNQDLKFSFKLNKFKTDDKVPVTLTYIITNPQGNIVLIRHEDKKVSPSQEISKSFKLPKLIPGKHTLFIEMLHSKTETTASAEFLSS